MQLHEQAYELAKQGKTNVEIFGFLQVSAVQLLRIAISDVPLLYSIIRGRTEYLDPFIRLLEQEATDLVAVGGSQRNFRALQQLIERMDKETRALGVGYDLSLLSSAPAPKDNQLKGAELTKALRETA